VELASKIFPLKPQERSVTPSLKESMIIVKGFESWGFHIDMVDSALANAITLKPSSLPSAALYKVGFILDIEIVFVCPERAAIRFQSLLLISGAI